MTTIKETMRDENVRLSAGNRWLVIDELYDISGEFVVYEHKYGAKKTTEVYRGTDESKACEMLLE